MSFCRSIVCEGVDLLCCYGITDCVKVKAV